MCGGSLELTDFSQFDESIRSFSQSGFVQVPLLDVFASKLVLKWKRARRGVSRSNAQRRRARLSVQRSLWPARALETSSVRERVNFNPPS